MVVYEEGEEVASPAEVGQSREARLWSPSGHFRGSSGVSFCHITLRSGSEAESVALMSKGGTWGPRVPLDGDAVLILEILFLLSIQ